MEQTTIQYLPSTEKRQQSTSQVVQSLKDINEDFEWYPTTDEMIKEVAKDLARSSHPEKLVSFLDVCAGDGRVLNTLQDLVFNSECSEFEKLGIELSTHHVSNWGDDIIFCGGDMWQQNLSTKKADILFCNPPYSDYENWFAHIINNAYPCVFYFVVPERWAESKKIKEALMFSDLKTEIIYVGDFSDGDRKARGKVNIVRVTRCFEYLKKFSGSDYDSDLHSFYVEKGYDKSNFEKSFEKEFPNISGNESAKEKRIKESEGETDKLSSLIVGEFDLITLVDMYQSELSHYYTLYKTLEDMDLSVFDELNINFTSIQATLDNHIKNLRMRYWEKFLYFYDPIRKELTTQSIKNLFGELNNQFYSLDFTADNAEKMTHIVLRQANQVMHSQVVDFYKSLAETGSIKNYKSNQRVFEKSEWRYQNYRDEEEITHYGLDYRIIGFRMMNIYVNGPNFFCGAHIPVDGFNDIDKDLQLIAKICGVKGRFISPSISPKWIGYDKGIPTGEKMITEVYDDKTDKYHALYTFKGFKNKNMHLQLNQNFALRLNVLMEKMLGWLHSAEQAAEDLELTPAETKQVKSFYDDLNAPTLLGSDRNEVLKLIQAT